MNERVEITATIEGRVDSPTSTRLRLQQVKRRDGAILPGKIDVYLYGASGDAALKAGRKISAVVKLHPPANHLNPGAFDYRAYCFDRHIALVGSAYDVAVVADARSWLQRARERITDALPERQGSAVIRALLLADRSSIGTDVQDAFAASGAAHLLAISGLHVGMAAGWGFLIAWWLLTRREAWIIAIPVRRTALLCGLLLALFYTAVAGWPIPAQRSLVMLAAGVAAWWLRSRAEPLNTMLAALMLLLLFDPAAILSISFWLSFVAVASLLLWAKAVIPPNSAANTSGHDGRLRRWLAGLFQVSLIAALATLPIIVDLFGRLPTWTLIANLILVPLYSVMVLPMSLIGELLAISGIPAIATHCFDLAALVIEFGNSLLQTLQGWPAGNLRVADVPLWVGVLYAAGLAISLLRLHKKGRAAVIGVAALSLCAYLLLAMPEHYPEQPTLVAWDVGQGAASSLLLPGGEVMVIDAPGRFGSRFNGGTDVVAGLRTMGIVHADVVVLSHAQSDHAGGGERLISGLQKVGALWLADVPANRSYAPMQAAIRQVEKQGGDLIWLKRGDRLKLGAADVDVLWPPQGYAPTNGNNSSLVLSVRLANGKRILFPADIESLPEQQIVKSGLSMHEVALVPHHGSSTSSGTAWVEHVQPDVAIVQSGQHNRYRFPRPEVAERYRQAGAMLIDSKFGAVTLKFGESGESEVEAEQYRPAAGGKRERVLLWWRSHSS